MTSEDEAWETLAPPRTPRRRLSTLHQLGRCLAAELHGTSVPTIDDWSGVAATAAWFRLTPALWQAVRDRADLPPSITARLRAAYARNVVTLSRLSTQLQDAIGALNEKGIRPVVLKGARELLRTDGVLPARMMTDIDLLVSPSELGVAVAALEEHGYHVLPGAGVSAAFEFTARRDDRPSPVDLHTAVGVGAVVDCLPTDALIARARGHDTDGLRFHVLEPADELAHAVLHSQLGDKAHQVGAIPLRQLHNFATLYVRDGSAAAWATALERLTAGGFGAVVGSYAELQRRFFNPTFDVPGPNVASRLHMTRCLATYAVPGLSDVELLLAQTFEAPNMALRYPGTSLWSARSTHLAHVLRAGPGSSPTADRFARATARMTGSLTRRRHPQPRPVAHFVHVTKTAGTALKAALADVDAESNFRVAAHGHDFRLRDVPQGDWFFFSVRDPVERFVSGFLDRQRLGRPRFFAPWRGGEEVAFARFASPEELAVALSAGGERQRVAEEAMDAIGHVSNSYWEWFGDADALRSRVDRLLWIGRMQAVDYEVLARRLHVDRLPMPEDPVVAHRSVAPSLELSAAAERNIRRWYARDYDFLRLCDELDPLISPPPPAGRRRGSARR